MQNKAERNLVNFIAEAGLLKRVKRSGWWTIGIKDPESVADHSFRCAVIGYILAKMEKCDTPYEVLLLTLFNDICEARINDQHKLAQRYMDFAKAEDKAFKHQMEILPDEIKNELIGLNKHYRKQDTKEAIIARDADILECLIQAREYEEQGFKQATKFMQKGPQHLKTKSAKKLWKLAQEMDLHEWWNVLSVFER